MGFDLQETIDMPSYQAFVLRGLALHDTSVRLGAVLAIVIAKVASVVITAQPAQALGKCDKISSFLFDGPNLLLMFEEKRRVVLGAATCVRCNMRTQRGKSPNTF